ncbi:MAG: GWxTD domain-containing protein [Acidobacteria bacterium]|nr:GWxTD domain-containing protein [Acidobacteriota bacterium]
MAGTRALILPILWLLAAPSLSAEVRDYRRPDREWARGPVRWLMSEDEEKQFKGLKTDEARAAFVKEFWEKRDPTPGTPLNEFEVIFWKKVEEADKTLKPIAGIGSLTDMGRVYLLLGPPTKSDKDTRGRNVWTFEPNEVTGIKEPLALTFASGTSAPLLLDRKILEKYVASHPETRGIGWRIPAPPPAEEIAQAPAAPARDPAEDLTPESRRQIPILEDLLSKGAGPGQVPAQAVYDYYAAADGTTLTVITVEIPRDAAHGGGDTALFPFARLVPAAGGQPVNVTGDLPFVPAADVPPGSYVYQARRNLAPGSYRIGLIVEDRVIRGQMGSLVQTIEVPDFSGKEFGLSSIALLAKFTSIQAGLGPDDDKPSAGPYVLGSFRLVPRAVPSLLRNETLAFYYQVYNPAPDPASGRPSLEVTYTFHIKDDAGSWRRFGKPIVQAKQGQVELYAVDAKDLIYPNQKMPAAYRLEIAVADKVSGKSIQRELAFSIN